MDEGDISATYLSRLREVEQQARLATDSEINKWEKFEKDYKDLRKCLETLPTTVSHSIMVPVGSVALFPAQLIHTNEILVLLGDNWFAQRSAHQACQVVDRRLKHVENNLAMLKQDARLHSQNAEFMKGMQAEQELPGSFEIKEPLEESTEVSSSRTAHAPNHGVVPRSVNELDRKRNTRTSNGDDQTKDDQDLWQRLNQLELEEQREDNAIAASSKQLTVTERKIEGLDSDDDDEEEDGGDTNDSRSSMHSASEGNGSHVHFHNLDSGKTGGAMGKSLVEAFDDCHKEERPLKSILKKERKLSTEDPYLKPILKTSPEQKSGASSDEGDSGMCEIQEGNRSTGNTVQAFSGHVVETENAARSIPVEEASKSSKPVSRFKASRQRKS